MDLLALSVAKTARAGSRTVVSLALNRQGFPVKGATVFVQISTKNKGKSTTVTVPVQTKADGTAKVAVPVSVRGQPGASSIIQASTNDARAQGVKGSVAILSIPAKLSWT